MKNPTPTIKLEKIGLKFRRDVLKSIKFEEIHDFHRLDLASHCLDRLEQCRLEIEADGPFVLDRFKVKREHPALRVEKDQKIIFCRILRELQLDVSVAKILRPPKLY